MLYAVIWTTVVIAPTAYMLGKIDAFGKVVRYIRYDPNKEITIVRK